MSSKSDGSGTSRDNTSHALLPFEKKALQEARSFAITCGNRIADEKTNFASKGWWGLWWDAKGFSNVSNAKEVTDYMEKYVAIYKKIEDFSAQVEKGDKNSYERLIELYNEIADIEKDAESDVENKESKAVCRVLREFLAEKYKLDHNMKKVECVVLKQKIRDVEQCYQSSRDAVSQLNEKMSRLLDENRDVKRFLEAMRREKEELASEAHRRSDVIRQESDEMLKQLLMESEARIREMKKENEELRLENEKIRVESENRLKIEIDKANKSSEARMQKMTEKNDAALKKLTKMLEDMKIP